MIERKQPAVQQRASDEKVKTSLYGASKTKSGDKARERRYHDRHQHADDQGDKADDAPLVGEDARNGRRGHAQDLVERELAGAATQDEAVRVDDEECEDDDGEHRERLHDAVG